MSPCKFWEQNFEIFTIRGRFWQKKTQKISNIFNVLKFQAAITPQWLQIAGNSLPNWHSTGGIVSIFTVRINSKSFLYAVRSVQERYLPKFLATFDVRLGKPRTPLCCLADGHGKSRLNWKLKISNTADNAGITQSQARDTRHRRQQEVNSLCKYSGPLRSEYCIVALHNTAIWLSFVVVCNNRYVASLSNIDYK